MYVWLAFILFLYHVKLSQEVVQATAIDDTECNFSGQFHCEQSKRCIPIGWKCDGKVDCSINEQNDKSDEKDCSPKKCAENEHSCKLELNGQHVALKCVSSTSLCNGVSECTFGDDEDPSFCAKRTCKSNEFKCLESLGACIPKEFLCDKNKDCPGDDKSDEDPLNCLNQTMKCDSEHRQCDNKDGCINVKLWCDGSPDCDDGSDESPENCPKKGCDASHFMCRSNRQCISNSWVCDGASECPDGSDEDNCTKSVNLSNITKCSNPDDIFCSESHSILSQCIPKNFRCDSHNDCQNGEDETNCPTKTCQSGEFRCQNGACVSGNAECDGNHDCQDGSDEFTCPTRIDFCDMNRQFDCKYTGDYPYNRRCVPIADMCDFKKDCYDGSDENPDHTGAVCIQKEKNSCTNNNGGCTQICSSRIVISPGPEYVALTSCSCRPGFQLASNGLNCDDVNECSIFGSCSQQCENKSGYFKCFCQEGYFLINRTTCRAIGEKYLLHSTNMDIREKRLINGNMDPVQSNVRAVALDFSVQSNPRRIFYSDYHMSEIIMLENGPKMEKNTRRLAHVGVTEGLAYDWVHQLLYYTDSLWKTISCINVTSGDSVVVISGNISEPRGITVNPMLGYIYWTDWGSRPKIERAATDGSDRVVLFDHPSKVLWPNGITFDLATNRIFWTDAKLHAVVSSTWDGADYRVIVDHRSNVIEHPFSISVFEDYVYYSDFQRGALTRCNKFTGKQCNDVSHGYQVLAVTVMHELRQPLGSRNYCANHRCSFMCLPRPRYQSSLSSSLSYLCTCPPYFKLASDGITCKKIENVSYSHVKIIKTVQSVRKPVVESGSATSFNASLTGKVRVGQLAGAVIGVLIAIVILSALLGALVYRNYMKRGIRSMNFDNPVYRKTTVDHAVSIQHYKEYQPIIREGARLPSQNCALEHKATVNETVDSSPLAV